VGLGAAVLAWFALYEANLPLWNWLLFDVVGLDPDTRLGSGVHFFFYDSVKIALLLVGIIFAVTVLRSFMSVERTRALLGGKREGVGNVMAAGLGVVTPFCSCSAVPAFIGFVAAGVPLGVTLSFLIASPLVNEVAIALLFGMFGIGPTVLYVGAGLVIAILAGFTLGRLRLERWVEPFVFETRLGGQVIDSTAGLGWDDRIQMGVEEVGSILRKIWPYLLVGIGLGAVIHGWAPQDFFARYAGADNPFAVLIAVVIGIPLSLLQRGWDPAAHRRPVRQGHAHGHPARLHDGHRGLEPAGDDPAAPRTQAQADRRVRLSHRRRHHRCRLPVQRHPLVTESENLSMNIKILGSGCANCINLEKAARLAASELGIDATFEKVTDYADIASYGIMRTPGLVVDEQVLLAGRVPTAAQVKELLAPLVG
jgi:small redox-active disulfide protein 2